MATEYEELTTLRRHTKELESALDAERYRAKQFEAGLAVEAARADRLYKEREELRAEIEVAYRQGKSHAGRLIQRCLDGERFGSGPQPQELLNAVRLVSDLHAKLKELQGHVYSLREQLALAEADVTTEANLRLALEARLTAHSDEELAREVRIAWVEWAKTQANPKPSWLVPWEELDETDREADRYIARAIRQKLTEARASLTEQQALSAPAVQQGSDSPQGMVAASDAPATSGYDPRHAPGTADFPAGVITECSRQGLLEGLVSSVQKHAIRQHKFLEIVEMLQEHSHPEYVTRYEYEALVKRHEELAEAVAGLTSAMTPLNKINPI